MVWEDPTCPRASRPSVTEPVLWSPEAAGTEAQKSKTVESVLLTREAPTVRSPHTTIRQYPLLLQLEIKHEKQCRPSTATMLNK